MKSRFHIPTAAHIAAVVVFISLLSFYSPVATGAKHKYPDFAYPQTVKGNAETSLLKASATGNWGETTKAAIQMVTADNLINRENAVRSLHFIDSLTNIAPDNWKPAFLLIQANIYNSIYNSIRWQADKRKLPLDSVNVNPFEWSRDIFADRIYSLCKEAMSYNENQDKTLKNWSSFLIDTDDAYQDGMTIREFIDMQCFSLLNTFCDETKDIIPFFSSTIAPTTPGQKCAMLRNKAIDDMIIETERLKQSIFLAKALTDKANCFAPSLRIKNLLSALDRVNNTEGSQLILMQLHQYVGSQDNIGDANFYAFSQTEYVNMLRESIKQFPNGKYVNALKNIIAEMTLPYASIKFKSCYLSSDSIEANVELANCNNVYFLVYDYSPYVNSEHSPKTSTVAAKCRLVKTVKATAEGEIPFKNKVKTMIGTLPHGVYVVIPSNTPNRKGIFSTIKDNTWRDTFTVSDINVMSLQYMDGSTRVFVVDGCNGAPIEGATVEVYSQTNYREKSRLIHTLHTDKDGAVTVKEKRFEIRASHNGSKWESKSRFYNHIQRKDTATVSVAQILPDRAICQPGDSINVAVVAFNRKNNTFSLDSGKDFILNLLDANGKQVQTQPLTSDESGRATAGFLIPNHGLSGNWTLTVTNRDKKRLGSTTIQVQEYVAPTFFITSEISCNEVSLGDSVNICGVVQTYSGMPIADAKVKYHVEYVPPMRWFNSGRATFDSSVTANSKGEYSISLPTANLKSTKFEYGIFTIALSAVSPAGETQAGPIERFSTGKKYSISFPEINTSLEASADERIFTVNVLDMLGNKVTKKLNYVLTEIESGKIATEGTFNSPTLTIPVKKLPSAKYHLDITLSENSLVKASTDIVVWRSTDKKAPIGTGLWVPHTKVKALPGSDKVKVTIGNGKGNHWVSVVEYGNDSIISQRWIYIDKDNVIQNFNAPSEGHTHKLYINSISNLENESTTVEIEPSVSDRLEVNTITFRDKISAGDKEKWTFKFSKNGLPVSQIPALAVMTDASLNAITPFSWSFAPTAELHKSVFSMRISPIRNLTQTINLRQIKYLSYSDVNIPEINTYGQEWGFGYNMNVMMYAKQPTYVGARAKKLSTREVASVSQNSSLMSATLADGIDNVTTEESEVETEESAMADTGTDMAMENAQEQQDTFRDNEYPVAFFKPLLNADSNGIVSIDFTVPDFNTTWALQLIGYDKDLKTAKISLETVASKPVMVKVNSPRFVRTGDNILLTATLFNNSDSTASVSGKIELVNLITGTIIASQKYEPSEMEKATSRLIEMAWSVPQNVSSIGFRAYAESDSHRDGEQALLPVLPASSPVIETTPFLIAYNTNSFNVKLPEFRNSDRITLRYCDNPTWYCLSALPDIVYPETNSITSKTLALYGNTTAFNLISGDASLKAGLEAMLSDKNSEFATLKSNLEKDGNLKITDLGNTPWVNDAVSETLRMSRLSSLLNDSLASLTIGKLTNEIRSLQTAEGGWSWCPDMQPSPFITGKILEYFGMMMKSGAITHVQDAEGMIKKALEYLDAKTIEDYRKYHKKGESLSYLLDHLYIRSMFPKSYLLGKNAKDMEQIATQSLKDIAHDWKSWNIGEKSKAAILMWRCGMHKDANAVLESLRQYLGNDGDNDYNTLHNTTLALEAFTEIQPNNSIIDNLRQNLVFKRQTSDWGRTTMTAETVNAILTSGSDWTKSDISNIPSIYIGNKKLKLPQIAAMTGAFTMSLDAKQVSKKKLTVSRTSTSPAWGSVISQYESPILQVKEANIPDLSIRKQIVALIEGENGELIPKTDIKLRPDMKARVTLTIAVGREMDYVALTDERSACLEPTDQLSGFKMSDGVGYYQEVRDNATNLFFDHLTKGHHVISYDCNISQTGVFSCGIATIQSQYAPDIAAHSCGQTIIVE